MRSEGAEQYMRELEEQKASESKEDSQAKDKRRLSRRNLIQGGLVAGMTASMAAGGMLHGQAAADAQQVPPDQETPIGPQWWPSRWGSEDEAGASNWMTPDKILTAAKLIKTGKIYEMGRIAEGNMPVFGQRGFLLRIVGSPAGGPLGDNKIVWNDEFLATEIGHVGTCLDGLGHIGCQVGQDGDHTQMRFYNGFSQHEVVGPHGLKKLGMEKVKPFFTRGVLVDIVALKGRMLNKGEEITAADLRGALARQKISEESFSPGDAIFFNTGWGSLWMTNNSKYNDGEPGIGMEVAQWIAGKQLSLVGADNWGVEAVPNPDASIVFPAHNELITKHGIFIYEGLDFTELLEDRVYEFAYVLTPLRIKGATGSISRPIAIA